MTWPSTQQTPGTWTAPTGPSWSSAPAPPRPGRRGLWASTTVTALAVVATLLGVVGSTQDLFRSVETYGQGDDAETRMTSETGWSGVQTFFDGTVLDYSVVPVGLLVVAGAVLLLVGAGLSFIPRFRAGGLALGAPGAGILAAAAAVPPLRVSAILADDPGVDLDVYRSFDVGLAVGGHLLLAAAVLAGVAAVVGVVGATTAGSTARSAGPQPAPGPQQQWHPHDDGRPGGSGTGAERHPG